LKKNMMIWNNNIFFFVCKLLKGKLII
jgi:hypothetical protein